MITTEGDAHRSSVEEWFASGSVPDGENINPILAINDFIEDAVVTDDEMPNFPLRPAGKHRP
ncbi:MAG: hypothetical protein SH850_26105 [Planctomycetaceae bacterium]|nr:hypothetical protein [Planctomycetaceae bacterium]